MAMTGRAARPAVRQGVCPAWGGDTEPVVMGILNVTPDSFSDGDCWGRGEKAVGHGLELIAQGAHIVDVGGESTRPGAARVTESEELARVLPVVGPLAAAGVLVSIDTTRASVAAAALESGARMVNDVSGGLADPDMLPLVAAQGVPYVLMHSRGPSATMAQRARYADVVAEVVAELDERVRLAAAAGVDPTQVVLDPGLGFAKTAEQDWQLLTNLDRLCALGHPVLVGASRKSFLRRVVSADPGAPAGPAAARRRDPASAATAALAVAAGAWGVRVHDVACHRDAVRVGAAWRRLGQQGAST